ncbi:hypothetical protein BDZ91DRAFT_728593 [Kalaharituber pfeilii]|nr:hypothetical protein BDZ91DRAFT_728593 [Kalaharituber pfeilii]
MEHRAMRGVYPCTLGVLEACRAIGWESSSSRDSFAALRAAHKSGVPASAPPVVGSTPGVPSRISTTSYLLVKAATDSGVVPSMHLGSGSMRPAAASSSARTSTGCPTPAAACSAACPYSLQWLGLTAYRGSLVSRCLMMRACPSKFVGMATS